MRELPSSKVECNHKTLSPIHCVWVGPVGKMGSQTASRRDFKYLTV